MEHLKYYSNKDAYSDLDISKILEDFSKALQTKTFTNDYSLETIKEFTKLEKNLHKAFPLIASIATINYFDKSILVHVPGSDPTLKPYLLMAHQDVVSVDPKTLGLWKYPPFSGHRNEDYIWGRGSLDVKCHMIAELEAYEYLLSKGMKPQRAVYFAYGHDEEIGGQNGAKRIAEYLEKQNVTLELVIDEGAGYISKGVNYQAPETYIGEIGLYEKGYADLKLTVKGNVGHSSNPYGGTSLGHLSKAISTIVDHPYKPHLTNVIKESLRCLKPYITGEPLKTYVQDIEKYENDILEYFINHSELNRYVQTTIAPTVINGGALESNILPGDMEAIINFRLCPSEDVDKFFPYYRKMLDEKVWMTPLYFSNASKISRFDTHGYQKVKEALNFCYQDVVFIPSICTFTTDARYYEKISDTVLRVFPFLNDIEIYKGIHGIDEKIEKQAFIHGVKFFIKLIELMNH